MSHIVPSLEKLAELRLALPDVMIEATGGLRWDTPPATFETQRIRRRSLGYSLRGFGCCLDGGGSTESIIWGRVELLDPPAIAEKSPPGLSPISTDEIVAITVKRFDIGREEMREALETLIAHAQRLDNGLAEANENGRQTQLSLDTTYQLMLSGEARGIAKAQEEFASFLVDDEVVAELVNRFLRWPLPGSVVADPCAGMLNYPNRTGTNLLSASESKEMFHQVVRPVIRDRIAAFGRQSEKVGA